MKRDCLAVGSDIGPQLDAALGSDLRFFRVVQLHAPQIGFIPVGRIENLRAVRRDIQNSAVTVVDGQLHRLAAVQTDPTDLPDAVTFGTVKDGLAIRSPNWGAVLSFVVRDPDWPPAAGRHNPNIALSVAIVSVGDLFFVRRHGKVAVLWL